MRITTIEGLLSRMPAMQCQAQADNNVARRWDMFYMKISTLIAQFNGKSCV